MSDKLLSYFLKNENIALKTRFQIALQCAPFLKGAKISSVITMEAEMCRELSEIFQDTGIEYRILFQKEARCLVFFFRRETLWIHLTRPDVQQHLQRYGYSVCSLDEMVDRLAERAADQQRQGNGFPHEIGVFLGYPKEDVEGFIRNQGQAYLFAGYWKVYSNPSRARKIFQLYDRLKEYVVWEFLEGKSIKEIAQ